MAVCPAFDPLGHFITGLAGFIDCHARALGELGYLSWMQSGAATPLLGGLVTILIALFGYRLLLGETPDLNMLVSLVIRIGLVLVLATQWPAYQTLVYNLVIDGPAQLAGQVLAPDGLGGGDPPGLLARGQAVVDMVAALLDPARAKELAPADVEQLQTGSLVFLMSTLGGLLATRLTAALLLALGPLFVACLLFDGMRGFFVGWVRGLGFAALGALVVPALLALELAVVEPQMRALEAAVGAGQHVPALATEFLAATSLFALALAALLFMAARVMGSFELPVRLVRLVRQAGHALSPAMAHARPTQVAHALTERPTHERAQALSDAILTMERREEVIAASQARQARSTGSDMMRDSRPAWSSASEPLGQNWRRTTQRRSVSAERRERRR